MSKFTISWEICRNDRSFEEKTRCGFWMKKLNAEWKIKCICEQKLQYPACIELHRKKLAGESILSGTLEMYDAKRQCLLKKKFVCLLEDRRMFTRIDLQYPHEAAKSFPDKLLVTGEITISDRTEASLNLSELVEMIETDYPCLRQLSRDMERLLLLTPFLSDAILKCGSVKIPVNKSILSARSPVFEAMFRCPMMEARESCVMINDIEPPILQAMIKYMYTGKTEDLEPSLASDLLFAANKYQIASLESACSKYLMRKMSMENVASVLLIGDFVSPDMKNFVTDFLCNKCTDYSALEKTQDWISLKNSKPALALEIFSAVIKSQEQKLKCVSKMV